MSRARCSEWHARFKRGRTSLEDDERSGWPSTSSAPKNVEIIRRLVHKDRWRTIKDIAAIINVSYGTVQTILTCDLNMHYIAAKFVPPNRKRTELQFVKSFVSVPWMTHPSCRGSSLGTRVGSTSMIPRLTTVFAMEEPRITKSMLVFFDIWGILHHEFAPKGHTMNAQFYCSVLRRLREDIRRKRPELWRAGNWLLHDDNAPCHRALVTHE